MLVIDLLKKDYPSKVGHSVSHTTRAPRPGEVDGIHYHFVTPDKFQELVDQNKFIETAYVHTNRYGTTFDAVKAVTSTGKLCLLDLDVQGCQSVRRVQFGAYLVFIAPPSMEALVDRLRKRGTEDEEKIAIRIATATKEMEFVNDKMFDKLIINDDLDQCYSKIKEIICEMEHGFLDVPEIKA
jgi:guanylate kinase